MSWLFSQALVAEYSAENSSDGAPSAPSNTTPTPQAFLWRVKTTDAWSRFPSGMTCEHLTDDRGEGLLTWFREGFRAPTIALVSTPTTAATITTESQWNCGGKWLALSVRWDRASSSWKIVRDLFAEDLPAPSPTLPQWGLMVDGELYQRKTQALPISASDSGGYSGRMYPTPRSRDHHGECRKRWGNRHSLPGALANVLGGKAPPPKFSEWLMGWPTEWTDLKPLATDKFQQWLRSHGVSSADPDSTQPHTPE
jgi:hypothetical protein